METKAGNFDANEQIVYIAGWTNNGASSAFTVEAGKTSPAGTISLAAKLIENNQPVLNAKITAHIVGQNTKIEFFDDGKHGDAAAERSEVDSVLAMFAKIKRAGAEDRREARRIFLNSFLPNLKKIEATNPPARFLIEVLRRAHNGKDVLTALDQASGDPFDRRALGKAANADGAPNVVGK